MLVNNCWHTNFAADEHGIMEFQFDLVWRRELEETAVPALADALTTEPVAFINGPGADDTLLIERLFRPQAIPARPEPGGAGSAGTRSKPAKPSPRGQSRIVTGSQNWRISTGRGRLLSVLF